MSPMIKLFYRIDWSGRKFYLVEYSFRFIASDTPVSGVLGPIQEIEIGVVP